MHKIDILILTGGQGKRLRKVVSDKPKTMAEIDGHPFLDILIDYASGYGFKRFILCTGYMSDVITNHYSNKKTVQEILFSHKDKPLGTAGAVKNAEGLIQSNPFMVINGDSFCAVNLAAFLEFHFKKAASLSMVVSEVKDAKDYGTVAMDDSHRILEFQEKEKKADNKKGFVNAGIYLFNKNILALIPPDTKYSLEYDFFPKLVGQKFYGYITNENFADIGTPERYREARKTLSRQT